MRGMYACCLCALLIVGCGGDDEQSPQDVLIGTWGAPVATYSLFGCDYAFTFAPDDTYEDAIICMLSGGAVGYHVIVGRYEMRRSTITITPTAASCPGVPKEPATFNYKIEKGQLQLHSDAVAFQLDRVEDDGLPPTAATIVRGCFKNDGTFTQYPLTQL